MPLLRRPLNVRGSAGAKRLVFYLQCVRTGRGGHPAYTAGIRSRAAGSWSWTLTSQVKNQRSHTSTYGMHRGNFIFVAVVALGFKCGKILNHQQLVFAKQNIRIQKSLNTMASEVSPCSGVRLVCKQAEQEAVAVCPSPDGDHHGRFFLSMEKRFISRISVSTLQSLITGSQHNGPQPGQTSFHKSPYTQTC